MAKKMLEGKVCVVTGGGRGIGRAIALVMAENGAKIVVNDVGAGVGGEGHDETPAQSVVREIEAAHGQGQAVVSTDSVAEWDSAQRIIATAMDTFGKIDVVVNNAGILRDVIFHRMTPEDFDAVMKVHLYGAFYMSRAAIPHMRAAESGCFVHMTSTSGLIGSIGQVNYAAAKLGIAGLSRAIASDSARYNVRSNCIGPHAFSRMIESIPGQSEEQMQQRGGPACRLPGLRRGRRRHRADHGRARQRDLPVQPAAPDPHHAPRRRLVGRADGRHPAAGLEGQPDAAGADARRIPLRRHLSRGSSPWT